MSSDGVKESGINHMTSTNGGLHLLAIGLALTALVLSVQALDCYCYPGEYCSNKICKNCPFGTYQPAVGYSIHSCTPWTQKGRGWVVETMGTNQTDTIWKCAEGFFMVNSTECREKEPKLPSDFPDWLVAVIVIVAFVLIITVIVAFLRYKKLFCFSNSYSVGMGAHNNGKIPETIEMGPVNTNNPATTEQSDHNRTTIGPQSDHNRTTIGPQSDHNRTTIGPQSDHNRTTIGPQSDHVHVSSKDVQEREQEKLLNNGEENVETQASNSNATGSYHQSNRSKDNTFENLHKAVSIPYSLNDTTIHSVEDEPSVKKDSMANDELSAIINLNAKVEQSAMKDSSPKEESGAKEKLYGKKSSENYVAQLHELMKTIEKLMTSPEDFTTFCSVYLVLDREEGSKDLVQSYLQWARQNPKHNYVSEFRGALESFGYTLPDQKSDADSDIVGGIEDLKNAITKKIQLKNAFNKLCFQLRFELGNDVLSLLNHLNIFHHGRIDEKYVIPPLVDWAMRGAGPENGTWCILEEMKKALRDIKRNDIVQKFDVLAYDVILECKK